MNKLNIVFGIIMILNVLVLSYSVKFIYDAYYADDSPLYCQGCMMYNPDSKFGISGIYSSGKGYCCVWTEGRTYEQINTTERHETCHVLIDKDRRGYFCDEKYKKE